MWITSDKALTNIYYIYSKRDRTSGSLFYSISYWSIREQTTIFCALKCISTACYHIRKIQIFHINTKVIRLQFDRLIIYSQFCTLVSQKPDNAITKCSG